MNEKILKVLPQNIITDLIKDVDILSDAPEKFIDLVIELELTLDYKKRAEIAKKYIDDNDGLKYILYNSLGLLLKYPSAISKTIWRKLYLLERSIPPRFGDYYTWFARLWIFYNTYLHETKLHKTSFIVDGHKVTLYLRHGNDKNPIYHDRLVYGAGQYAADFYIFIEKMLDVEYKYCDAATVELGAAKYAGGNYTYKSKYLILFMSKLNKYYFIDYTKYPNNNYITELPVKA